ncbi:hypothetical protein [Aquimarina sp. Aq78]|uniref:hypothetical protein n=1 Tax=Aquimarina sp. Aq78 TaxID=1191889 RepID=UPI000D0F9CB7|nr:hypothetical protein [Aquimarina sp. Aq78]
MKIDSTTIPKCQIEEKRFSWGEPYTEITPIFEMSIAQELSDIEFCIELYIKNNFRNQLLEFYNVLTNYEENDRIENFDGTIPEQLREILLKKIKLFLDSTQKLTPWEKYNELLKELDYLYLFEEKFDRKILFIKIN